MGLQYCTYVLVGNSILPAALTDFNLQVLWFFFVVVCFVFWQFFSPLDRKKKKKRKESLFSAFCSACFWKVGLSFSSCFGISVL